MTRKLATIQALLFGAALSALGCANTQEQQQADMAPAPGTAKLKFKLSDTVRSQANPTGMGSLKGTIYGDLFLAEDVTLIGPIDGAMHFASIEVPVDLTNMTVSTASFTSMPLAPNRYNFLGFFDLGDKTKPDKREPIPGSPVTLALTNRFDVESGKQTEYTVTFDLLFN